MQIYHLIFGLTLLGIFLYIRSYFVQKEEQGRTAGRDYCRSQTKILVGMEWGESI